MTCSKGIATTKSTETIYPSYCDGRDKTVWVRHVEEYLSALSIGSVFIWSYKVTSFPSAVPSYKADGTVDYFGPGHLRV